MEKDISLLDDRLYCAGCGDCLNDPRVTTGEQCVKVRECSCHSTNQDKENSEAFSALLKNATPSPTIQDKSEVKE